MAAATVAGMVGGALVARIGGKDVNFDLLNYHFYAAHALLHGRFGHDVDVAQLQTYHFALLDVPFYVLVRTLPAPAVGAVLGALQGLVGALSFCIAGRVLRGHEVGLRTACAAAAACTCLGLYGPLAYQTFASTATDYDAAIFVLAALLVVLRAHQDGARTPTWTWGAGALVGLAIGSKLTNHSMFWPSLLTVGVAAAGGRTRTGPLGSVLRFAVAAGATFLATGGAWAMWLYGRFGNPLFPYYNDVFRSPWAATRDFAFHRCRPDGLLAAILHPLHTAIGRTTAIEEPFRDARYAVLFALVLALLIARRRRRPTAGADATPLLVLLFFLGLFGVWLAETAYLRYAPELELLAPLLIVSLLLHLLPRPAAWIASAACLVGVGLWMQPPHRHGQAWTAEYFGVRAPEVPTGDVLGVLLGDEPNAYLVPFFPERVAFVRLESNYQAPFGDTEMKRALAHRLADHRGPMFALSFPRRQAEDAAILRHYGLRFDETSPATSIPNLVGETATWRPLRREASARK